MRRRAEPERRRIEPRGWRDGETNLINRKRQRDKKTKR
jgi:hypothetical protein